MKISKLLLASTFAAAAFAIAVPVKYDPASASLVVQSAFAKKGADDGANHDVGDDKGGKTKAGKAKPGKSNKGGKGRGGADDGPNHR